MLLRGSPGTVALCSLSLSCPLLLPPSLYRWEGGAASQQGCPFPQGWVPAPRSPLVLASSQSSLCQDQPALQVVEGGPERRLLPRSLSLLISAVN